MSKYRQAARVDANQAAIVAELRALPGVTVAVGHDDILVGCRDKDDYGDVTGEARTYWFEIKRPDQRKKDGTFRAGSIKPSQIRLAVDWAGHYEIVSSVDEIRRRIGR